MKCGLERPSGSPGCGFDGIPVASTCCGVAHKNAEQGEVASSADLRVVAIEPIFVEFGKVLLQNVGQRAAPDPRE